MLSLYQEKSKQYDNVNYATTMSQLGRIRSLNKSDPSFLGFVEDLANLIEEKGLRVDWNKAISKHCPLHWENVLTIT